MWNCMLHLSSWVRCYIFTLYGIAWPNASNVRIEMMMMVVCGTCASSRTYGFWLFSFCVVLTSSFWVSVYHIRTFRCNLYFNFFFFYIILGKLTLLCLYWEKKSNKMCVCSCYSFIAQCKQVQWVNFVFRSIVFNANICILIFIPKLLLNMWMNTWIFFYMVFE